MKRALLIGSQCHGLSGVLNDIRSMSQTLALWGFDDIRECTQDATRSGILRSYRSLIDDAKLGDVIVLYYSGHGARALPTELAGTHRRTDTVPPEFIVPLDIDDSRDDDFRGVTSLELSMLLAELIAKSANVTSLIDCCHSGRMMRSARPEKTATPMVPRFLDACSRGIKEHLAKLRNDPRIPLLGQGVNRQAIRLLACTSTQSAYETRNELGRQAGVMTHALQEALTEYAGRSVPWRVIGDTVTSAVHARTLAYSQSPSLEGPIDRIVFKLHEQSKQNTTSIFLRRGQWWLRSGRLHDVHLGDRYAIMPVDRAGDDPSRTIAHATVTAVRSRDATVRLDDRGSERPLQGAPAVRIASSRAGYPVVVEGLGPLESSMRDALVKSMLLRPATEDERHTPIATITREDGCLIIDPGQGSLRREPWPATDEGIEAICADLEKLAHARAFLSQSSGAGDHALTSPVTIEWGQIVAGRRHPLPWQGAVFTIAQRFYVKLTNRSPDLLYFSIYDIGATGTITLLTTTSGAGIELEPGMSWTVGERYGQLHGIALGWPAEVPEGQTPAEHLLIVIANRHVDLRSLATVGSRSHGRVRDAILHDSGSDNHDDIQYRIERIDFALSSTNIEPQA